MPHTATCLLIPSGCFIDLFLGFINFKLEKKVSHGMPPLTELKCLLYITYKAIIVLLCEALFVHLFPMKVRQLKMFTVPYYVSQLSR